MGAVIRKPEAELVFTDADFHAIARIAKDDYGLHLEQTKKSLIYARLTRRVRALGLSDFADYLPRLQDRTGPERDILITALTTNVTHFFRESHHFDTLEQSVLPSLATATRNGHKLRIWSAGCSSGQEPYSIATSLLKVLPEAARFDCKILATDVDPDILTKAKAATYPDPEIDGIPAPRRNAMFEGSTIKQQVQSLVTFRPLNLMGDWPMRGQFDVIFCRNVAIYFDRATQERLWARFANLLRPGGHLFIGHSERVSGPALDTLATVGITTYQKKEARHGT